MNSHPIFACLLCSLVAHSAVAELRISAVCPRPGVPDANGKESGWVDLVNDGSEAVNLAEYELVRVNRGKKLEPGAKKKNLAKGTLAAGETLRVWTSEEYANCKDLGGSGNVEILDGRMIYPAKVNPKKFPYLALYHKTSEFTNLLDRVVLPVDIVDGGVFRRDTSVTTRYAWAIDVKGELAAYGPNVSPLYGVKHDLSDLAPTAVAMPGEPYAVSFPINPLSDLPGDKIVSVDLSYSADFGEEKSVPMTAAAKADKAKGVVWSAAIPAADIPAPGKLLRWRAKITDGDGNVWTSPSFRNPDDGYAWYGTIVEPGDLVDKKLQTWHLFVEGHSLQQMDVDADKQDRAKVPYNARGAIYDSQTGTYYDNVRIDLRGNTSGGFRKKSHGFRFSKCQPMKCTNALEGTPIEIRKTSLVAEYCDPAYVRQSLAFYLFRQTGNLVPFHYPVRVNLNGEFYQLAFHSARFSDELIEDQYGLDPLGYGYKNSGCLTPNLTNWVSCEKKTPDDGDETSATAKAPLKAWTTAFGSSLRNDADDQAVVTREVVKTFNLPAWINYLAAARITMECDDNWANLSTYWDKYGTGTWMPLGYDMNQSWGHIYYTQWNGTKNGLYAELDQHKAHPLFGGRRIISHVANGNPSAQKDGGYGENYAMEAVWQSSKFRRLYLRRLRTLMDTQLGAPGTPKEETPIWQYVVAVTNATWECAKLDYAKWRADEGNLPSGSSGTFWTKTGTYAWPGKVEHAKGVDDLWNDYIVPRRRHLYETHSIHNTAKGIGYAQNLSAGIPEAQFASTILIAGFELVSLTADDLLILNRNAEAVDLSGWKLGGTVEWTFPAGTVVDAGDTITVVKDRAAWIVAHDADLGARVVVGNATFTGATGLTLTPAGGSGNGFVFETKRRPKGWFDAQAQDFAAGADMTTLDAEAMRGSFTAEGAATGTVESRVGINRFAILGAMLEGDKIVFTPSEVQKAKKRVLIEMTVAIPDALVELPENPNGFAALTLAKTTEGAVSFAAYDGTSWHFVGHADVPAAEEVAYQVRLTLDYRRAQPMIGYAIKTSAGWLDLADQSGVASFPVVKPIERLVFAGCGDLGGVSGDYLVLPGFTFSIQ